MTDQENSLLYGGNAPYIEELYSRFLEDPSAVDENWRAYFKNLRKDISPDVREPDHAILREKLASQALHRRYTASLEPAKAVTSSSKQVSVLQLINSYRFRGHQQADTDPLHLQEQAPLFELDPAFHALTDDDMDTMFSTGSLAWPSQATLREILQNLRTSYCGHVGAEYMHITDTAQKRWIQYRLENVRKRPRFSASFRRHILGRLVAAEGLEQYLHTKYVGQKRFSLEGGDSLIPMLDELIRRAGVRRTREVVIGMAHRGRLNVLVNVMGKLPTELFQEFEGKVDIRGRYWGDVKYHQGFSSNTITPAGPVHLVLAFNPSHLEIIDPVVEGSVRARQERRGDTTGSQVMPVLIHGDAAFAGQGVVMETFNMSQARGFRTHGTVHIVINNQIGFTTSNPLDARSTQYCTEVARMVQAPIFHVNGDDPEAVVWVTQLAVDFRTEFGRDVVIDMVCYRRHGHSEADEPAVTQPAMYQAIKQHPRLRQSYSDRLIAEGVVTADEVEQMIREYHTALDEGRSVAQDVMSAAKVDNYHVDWTPYLAGEWTQSVHTGVASDVIKKLNEQLCRVPADFELHPQVGRILEDRRQMADGKLPLDWGFAETMAYATLLNEGYPVRLTGQDSGRGTFFHRHAVLHNQKGKDSYVPLRNLAPEQPRFMVIDSLLSEEAVLGFEYGYATATPEGLTIWEAQFGDFANNAQVVIDQFISSGEAKWKRLCGLVLFLPHGYDGQGPEHSSARLERYLQLCAGDNMQVCVPTTPSQIFHLLRRQMLRAYRKPLIVLTPKSLLRHRLAVSALTDLAEGRFQNVIAEIDEIKPDKVVRVIICTGKIYYELLEQRRLRKIGNIALLRVAQLNPFPQEDISAELAKFSKASEIVWCQEEPENQGAWEFMRKRLQECLGPKQILRYAGRPEYAAPAEGLLLKHREQQSALINEALREISEPHSSKRIA